MPWAVSLAGAMFVAGCGAEGADRPAAEDGPLQGVREWAGTVHDRQAAEVLHAWQQNRATELCTAAKGFEEWDWRGVIGSGHGWHPGVLPGLGSDELGEWEGELHVVRHRRAPADDEGTPSRATPDQERIVDACLTGAPLSEAEEARRDTFPDPEIPETRVVETLEEEFFAEVERVLEDVLPPNEAACVVSGGPVEGPDGEVLDDEVWNDDGLTAADMARVRADQALSEQIDAVPMMPDEKEMARIEQQVRDHVAKENAAVRTCIDADRHADLVQGYVEMEQQFAADRAEEIGQAREYWARVRSAAGELGWAPEEPMAGWRG